MALRTLTVPLQPPLDVAASLAGLGRWGDDGIDRWNGRRWLRAIRVRSSVAGARAVPVGTLDSPLLEVTAEDVVVEAAAAQLAKAFVRESGEARAVLIAGDPAVAAADARFPGLRPLLTHDPLTALVRSISAQQVNLTWAAETRRRLGYRYGTRLEVDGESVRALEADALASATVADLRALQLTTAKARSVIAVAEAALAGALDLEDLRLLPDEIVIARLSALYGIGRWSAEWFLARTLGRPVVVAGDLGVRKAVGRAYFAGRMPSEAEVRTATAHWGAAAGIAQQLLLNTLLEPAGAG